MASSCRRPRRAPCCCRWRSCRSTWLPGRHRLALLGAHPDHGVAGLVGGHRVGAPQLEAGLVQRLPGLVEREPDQGRHRGLLDAASTPSTDTAAPSSTWSPDSGLWSMTLPSGRCRSPWESRCRASRPSASSAERASATLRPRDVGDRDSSPPAAAEQRPRDERRDDEDGDHGDAEQRVAEDPPAAAVAVVLPLTARHGGGARQHGGAAGSAGSRSPAGAARPRPAGRRARRRCRGASRRRVW